MKRGLEGSEKFLGAVFTAIFIVILWMLINFGNIQKMHPLMKFYCVIIYTEEHYSFLIRTDHMSCLAEGNK